MSKQISGAEYPLHKIFSSDFDFYIPTYQRPYAWEVDQATVLFDDLYDFWLKEPDDTYFLGSIVLIKEEHLAHSAVVDGQQRLTTLTLLLAILTSRMSGDSRSAFQVFVQEPGSIALGLPAKPRLALRERDKEFFKTYVQELNFDALFAIDPANLDNDAKRNILGNAKALQSRFESKFGTDDQKLTAFGQFLLQRCYLVAVSTPNEKSAFRVFSVMNSRGLDLLPTDIIKADTIGHIAPALQDNYNIKWEDMEVQNGRDGFNNLFGHVRMIFAKEKARRSLLEEFREKVIPRAGSPVELIDNILAPYSDAFFVIEKKEYIATANAEIVNIMLRWLHRINFSDWAPPAIQFLSQKKNESEYVAWFFQKLERLTAYLHIAAKNINERIERYSIVLNELENEHSFANKITSIELTEDEKRDFSNVLNGNVYWLTGIRRNYAVLRLDSFMADGAAYYDPSMLTIEHVLPQTVEDGTEWASWWPDADERQAWVHRIANLVPLNKRRNSSASNFDFARKVEAYFGGKNNISSYVLTTQVLRQDSWTPAILQPRQAQLLETFMEGWDLRPA